MGVIIAGERSGVGKTTITLALLASLSRRQPSVQSFKVGPDYIDPMFHTAVTGRPCRNLDPVLTSPAYVQRCFAQHAATAAVSVVEGVMGLFDGARGEDDWASTAHVARLLKLPILLVIDCSHLSRSAAAIVHGYLTFDRRLQIAGLILNRVASDRHLSMLKMALEPLGVPIVGVLRREAKIAIPDRHLGLVPTDELSGMPQLLEQLATLGDQCFDWPKLWPLLNRSIALDPGPPVLADGELGSSDQDRVRIAIARDPAFSFYYPDNLDSLTHLGADLIPWSPLNETTLPANIQGLYLGGGFPEMFAAGLAANQEARQSVKDAVLAGLPTYAECGGLMYLCSDLQDLQGDCFSMAGVLPARVAMGARLVLGYRRGVAQHDTPLMTRGTSIIGHEFHRSCLSPTSPTHHNIGSNKQYITASTQNDPVARCPAQIQEPLYQLTSYNPAAQLQSQEGWGSPNLHASYIHLHWGAYPALPRRFVQNCRRYSLDSSIPASL